MYPHKQLLSLALFAAFLFAFLPGHAQINIRTSLGMGNRDFFQGYDDRSSAITFIGEYSKWVTGLGTGFAISYSNFKYRDESYPTIFIGSSGTIYIDQVLAELMDIEKIPLGGMVSPYVGALLGLNLGAGFDDNTVYYTDSGLSIFALYLNAGVAIYPIKNVGLHLEVGGPITPFSVGLSVRMGGEVSYRRPF